MELQICYLKQAKSLTFSLSNTHCDVSSKYNSKFLFQFDLAFFHLLLPVLQNTTYMELLIVLNSILLRIHLNESNYQLCEFSGQPVLFHDCQLVIP